MSGHGDGGNPGPWWAHITPDQVGVAAVKRRNRIPAAVAAAAMCAILFAAAASNPGQETVTTSSGATISPPTLEALADGCTGIVTKRATPTETGWVPVTEGEPAWDAVPPTTGGFSPTPYQGPSVVSGGAAITFSEALALLYRDWQVIWYTSAAGETEVASAVNYVESLPGEARVVLAPWPQGTSAEKGSRPWTFTSWAMTQSCFTFSAMTAEQFAAASETSEAPGVNVPLDETGPAAATN